MYIYICIYNSVSPESNDTVNAKRKQERPRCLEIENLEDVHPLLETSNALSSASLRIPSRVPIRDEEGSSKVSIRFWHVV